MFEIDVVVVTYGAPDLARACLRSLGECANDSLVLNVVVLDNDSPVDVVGPLRQEFPWAKVIGRSSNDGFGVATNEGIEAGTAPYVLLLNPDAAVKPDVLLHLVQRLAQDRTIGLIGPRLARVDGSFDHAAKRNSPDPVEAFRYLLAKLLGREAQSDYLAPGVGERETGDVDAVNGAFMLLRRSTVDEVGTLDEKYWMYGEDLDWCRRIRQHGLRVVYDGRVTASHIKAGSSGSHRGARTNYHFHRSMWLYYRDGEQSRRATDAVVALGILLHWVLSSAARVVSEAKSTSARGSNAVDN